jgi:cytochrome c biogenesis protein
MSSLNESGVENSPIVKKTKSKPIVEIIVDFLGGVLDFISSVRFGVSMLIVLVVFSMIGMLVVQQNVVGFDSYYSGLTPAERTVFGYLGFFDIYHSWYFNFLLLVLSLNIILASIDHFPTAWKYISTPKIETTKAWLKHQKYNTVIERPIAVDEMVTSFKKQGLKTIVTEKNGRTHVFGQSGTVNRIGAYIVHVFLLTLFLGHFAALQTGFDADVRFQPNQTTNEIELIQFNLENLKNPNANIQDRFAVQLPFSMYCTDIQQKLIDPKGSIEINNTLDWRTQVKITDPDYGETIADVSLNKPFNYRGYRFFQASAITEGKARTMELELSPSDGSQPVTVDLMRNGTTNLPDGTKIEYDNFWSDFIVGQEQSASNQFKNAAVKLKITKNGETKAAYAFANKLPDNVPIGAAVFGYKFKLSEFEKVPLAHVLSIKYDPYHASFIAWYIGGFGLMGALVFVFFVSHRRIWALIDDKETIIGGNTNRNHQAFEDSFNKITTSF